MPQFERPNVLSQRHVAANRGVQQLPLTSHLRLEMAAALGGPGIPSGVSEWHLVAKIRTLTPNLWEERSLSVTFRNFG